MVKSLSLEVIDKKVERYRAKLMAEYQLSRKDHKEFRALIESIFARYGNVAINLPALVSLCLQTKAEWNQPDWKEKSNELEAFIRAHGHQGDWIQISAGRNGGVRLINEHIMQGKLGATCKSVIVKPTHSRKTKTIKRGSQTNQ